MALALSLKGFNVSVIDGNSEKKRRVKNNGRTYALSRTSKNLLKNLGLWDPKRLNICPIRKIVLSTKTQPNENLRQLAEFQNGYLGTDPSSFMIEDEYLRRELDKQLERKSNIQLINSTQVLKDETNTYETQIKLSNDKLISTQVLIISDGRESELAKRLDKTILKKSYNQVAIVGNIAHDNDHKFVAHQLFLPGGPLAILPLNGKRSTFVWSLPLETGNTLYKTNDRAFANHLKQYIGHILKNPSLIQEKKIIPLYLRLLRDPVDDRKVFVGDSAQAVHPLAGQGLNIGLRDVASLVDVLAKGKKLGLDIGSKEILDKYQSWRSFDRITLATYTDLINALFSNNNKSLKFLREFGMNIVDRSSLLKRFFIKEAAGEYGELPNLLK